MAIAMIVEVPVQKWEKPFKYYGNTDTWFNHVLPTADGGLLGVGATYAKNAVDIKQKLFCVKTSKEGTVEWKFPYGPIGLFDVHTLYEGRSAVQKADGSYLIVGNEYFNGASGKSRIFMLNLDILGKKFVLKQPISGITRSGATQESNTRAYAMDLTKDGGYVIAGATNMEGPASQGFNQKGDISPQFFLTKYDKNDKRSFFRCYGMASGTEEANSVRQTDDLGYVLTGYQRRLLNGKQSNKFYVVKTDYKGITDWEAFDIDWYNPKDSCAHSIRQAADGGYCISFTGGSGGRLQKLNSAGKWMESYNFPEVGGFFNKPVHIAKCKDGGFLLAGVCDGKVHLVKTDPGYVRLWDSRFGGNGDYVVNCIDRAADGSYMVAGKVSEQGQPDKAYMVKIKSEYRNAEILKAKYDNIVDRGEVFDVAATMVNTGTLPWHNTKFVNTRFALIGITGDADKFGSVKSYLPDNANILPDQDYTFTFTLKAPEKSGKYKPSYMMAVTEKISKKLTYFGNEVTLDIAVKKSEP